MAPIRDPNIAFLVLIAGSLLGYWELLRPGLIAPGAIGATLVMLAVASLSSGLVAWQGVALCGAGIVLATVDARFAMRGWLALAAGFVVAAGVRQFGVRWIVALVAVPFVVLTSLLLHIAYKGHVAKKV